MFLQVGGLLGVCIGFSFCSLVEILYWFGYKLVIKVMGDDKVNKKERDEPELTQEGSDRISDLEMKYESLQQAVREMRDNRSSNGTSYSTVSESGF